jgi:light-independent protochlorophyllide reductase subunit B
MGFEGANVLFDTWVHPLMMGLEEHLLQMFRDDFEFHDGAGPSHLGGHGGARETVADEPAAVAAAAPAANTIVLETPVAVAAEGPGGWAADAEKELGKIPFFVRGKARRNTERYAAERGIKTITLETLYEAKSHYSR